MSIRDKLKAVKLSVDGKPFSKPNNTGVGHCAARLVSRSLDQIEAREIRWLWPGRVPYGMLTMLDGDPSHGKSLITLDLAARLTRGGPMPFSEKTFEPGRVLIVAAEDAAEEVIKPRAVTAGCVETMIRVSETIKIGEHERPIRLPDDFAALEREIVAYKTSMLAIDPILGFLSQAIDSHKDQSIRDVLHELKLMAGRTGVATIGLRHMNKSGSGNALYRGLGSIAIVAAARAAFAVDYHPTDQGLRVFAPTKCNLCQMPKSLTYRITDLMGHPVILWGDECEVTAADLGAKLLPGDSAKDEAVEFLRDLLCDGPMPSEEVKKRASAAGIKEKTLYRAKGGLMIKPYKKGFASSTWTWGLPAEGGQIPD